MDWFQKLPGFQRTPYGLEWRLLRLMPHVEPYVARTIRSVVDELDEPLASQAEVFVAQQLQQRMVQKHIDELRAKAKVE